MGNVAEEFVEQWIQENIRSDFYVKQEHGPDDRPEIYARKCLAAARAKGIREGEIEISVGNLKQRMARAIMKPLANS